MYAIVRSGGRQYQVTAGDTIYVDSLAVPAGQQVRLEDVLLVADADQVRVGSPRVPSAVVVGTVIEQGRDAKVRVFKYKKRKHYRRTRGHRQAYTALKIDSIQA